MLRPEREYVFIDTLSCNNCHLIFAGRRTIHVDFMRCECPRCGAQDCDLAAGWYETPQSVH